MLKSYFKIAVRSVLKSKSSAFINLFGLSVGIAVCYLIFLYVSFEHSYDRLNKKADRIYQLVSDVRTSTETEHWDLTSAPMGAAMKLEFPEVEDFVRMEPANILVRKGDIKFQEENAMWTDSSIFQILDFKMIKGSPQTALKDPNSVVLTESEAKKYFGNSDPIGQSLLLTGKNINAVVTGIIHDIPQNSTIRPNMLISMPTYINNFRPGIDSIWSSFEFYTYLLLRPHANPENVSSRFESFLAKYATQEMKNQHFSCKLALEPLTSIYLHSTRGAPVTGNLKNLNILTIVAIFILTLAFVNFVNLSTARSLVRAKEIGVKKVLGASRAQLIRQFLAETIVMSFVSFLIALILCTLLIPFFNQLCGKVVCEGIFSNPKYIFYAFAFSMVTGLAAGLYPAFALSSFAPVPVLNGHYATVGQGAFLRRLLVVAQFSVSIILLTATIIVYAQLKFMRSGKLGFDKEHVVVVDNHGAANINLFKEKLREIPGVVSASNSSSVPTNNYDNLVLSRFQDREGWQQIYVNAFYVDKDFCPLYKLKLLAGRTFDSSFPTDSTEAMVLNEAAVRKLGYSAPDEIIDKSFEQGGRLGRVIGVVSNFHIHSLKEVVQPISMREEMNYWEYTTIKVSSQGLPNTLNAIKEAWGKAIPTRPFNYFFLDKAFDKLYRSDENFADLILCFSILAIFISAIGMLGLVSYSVSQRSKEVSVRKVIGASISDIFVLISRDFLKLVLVGFVIAAPLACMIMHEWLLNYATRINIKWWFFLIAGGIAVIVALLAISYHSAKAALTNPINNIRIN